jgi:hypothetical protein
VPAWTDRVLYIENDGLRCVEYGADFTLKTSDHRPVFASFISNIDIDDLHHGEAMVPEFSSQSQVCNIM